MIKSELKFHWERLKMGAELSDSQQTVYSEEVRYDPPRSTGLKPRSISHLFETFSLCNVLRYVALRDKRYLSVLEWITLKSALK